MQSPKIIQEGMAEHKLTNNLEVMEGAEDTFKKISNYLLGELNLSTQDYKLLEEMNMVTAQKYSGMADNGAQLVQFMKDLRDKCKYILNYTLNILLIAK